MKCHHAIDRRRKLRRARRRHHRRQVVAIAAALRERFSAPEWAIIFEVPNATGGTAARRADAMTPARPRRSFDPRAVLADGRRPERLLKWPGGKAGLLKLRPDAFVAPEKVRIYREPFVGGGALFFGRYAGRVRLAQLNDINPRLVNLYGAVRDQPNRVADHFDALATAYDTWRPEGMEAMRAFFEIARGRLDEGDPFERAGRFLWVLIFGFNGLYRENSSGVCNTPHGDGRSRRADREHLAACSVALHCAGITALDFEESLREAQEGDFVYLDPPYEPTSATACFTNYAAGGKWQSRAQAALPGLGPKTDQDRLVDALRWLDKRRVRWTLSNADTPRTRELYREWHVETVEMRRAINSNGAKRGSVSELIVRNWQSAKEAA